MPIAGKLWRELLRKADETPKPSTMLTPESSRNCTGRAESGKNVAEPWSESKLGNMKPWEAVSLLSECAAGTRRTRLASD